MDKKHSKETDRFFEAILSLKNADECYRFFADVCTVKELRDMSQRLHVAEMLDGGSNYAEITQETGSSTTTISRVSRCLSYGTDGYRLVIDRMNKEDGDE